MTQKTMSGALDAFDALCDLYKRTSDRLADSALEPIFSSSRDGHSEPPALHFGEKPRKPAFRYLEPDAEQIPATDLHGAQDTILVDQGPALKEMQSSARTDKAAVPPVFEHPCSVAPSYECSLDRVRELYYNYAPHSHVCITLMHLQDEVERVTVLMRGAHKRENGIIAHEQRLVFSRRQGSKFVVDDHTDQAHFKMSACSVENRGGKVFIDLALDRPRIKLFTSNDRRDRPSELLDNTFSITVMCSLADGTSISTFIEPKMRILSRLSRGKRERDLPEDYRRNSKAARIDFERVRAAARELYSQ